MRVFIVLVIAVFLVDSIFWFGMFFDYGFLMVVFGLWLFCNFASCCVLLRTVGLLLIFGFGLFRFNVARFVVLVFMVLFPLFVCRL